MLIRIGYDIELATQADSTALLSLLQVHPSRREDLRTPETFMTSPSLASETYLDSFGNLCRRTSVPQGVERVRFTSSAVIYDSGLPEHYDPQAAVMDVQKLPSETLQYLIGSRYCEVDSELMQVAWNSFANCAPNATRVQAICDFVHQHIRFDYQSARATRTAVDVYRERVGVCRDYAHLAITLCRCMNIPARYVTTYLGDIGIAPTSPPMDFSACIEVFLGGAWCVFDPRNNVRRIGRIPIAKGRDAGDVPIVMGFGAHQLTQFTVISELIENELDDVGAEPAASSAHGSDRALSQRDARAMKGQSATPASPSDHA
jgi:transglutaminase-like putative cysteine protease